MSDNLKVVRAADAHLAGHPLPAREVKSEIPRPTVTAEFIQAYNGMPAGEVRKRYESDPMFAALVDEMLRRGQGDSL